MMLEREFRDAAWQFGGIMLFLAVIPLVYLLDSSTYRTGVRLSEYMIGGFGLLWLISTVYIGYNIFRSEIRDDSFEYVLSLPISRLKLLVWKTLPRILVLYVTAELSDLFGVTYFPGRALLLAFIVFTQVCGFTLGLVGRGSWMARLLLFLLVTFTYFTNSTRPLRYTMLGGIAGSLWIVLELAVLMILLLPVYSIWDLRHGRIMERRLALSAVLPLLLMAVPVIVLFSGGQL